MPLKSGGQLGQPFTYYVYNFDNDNRVRNEFTRAFFSTDDTIVQFSHYL